MKLAKNIFKRKKETESKEPSSSVGARPSPADLQKTSEATVITAADSSTGFARQVENRNTPSIDSSGQSTPSASNASERKKKMSQMQAAAAQEDSPDVINSYESIPVLEQTKLPRGGLSIETKAVGRVQVRKMELFA